MSGHKPFSILRDGLRARIIEELRERIEQLPRYVAQPLSTTEYFNADDVLAILNSQQEK